MNYTQPSQQNNQPSQQNNQQNQLDVNAIFARSELRLNPAKDTYDKLKDTILTIIFGIGLVVITYFCIEVLRSNTSSVDDKKWAQSTITFLVGGLGGYVTAKNQKE